MQCHLKTILLCASLVFLTACGSSVSQSNYDKVTTGMTLAEVEAILGKPTVGATGSNATDTGGIATWKDGDKSITVTYLNGKVVLKASSGL